MDEDAEVEIERDEEDDVELARKTLRQLITEAKVEEQRSLVEESTPAFGLRGSRTEQLDMAILLAEKRKDKKALIAALESKIEYLVSSTHPAKCSDLKLSFV